MQPSVELRAGVAAFEASSGMTLTSSSMGTFDDNPSVTFEGTLSNGTGVKGLFAITDDRIYGFVAEAPGSADADFQHLLGSFQPH
jgi:hypothetical protein